MTAVMAHDSRHTGGVRRLALLERGTSDDTGLYAALVYSADEAGDCLSSYNLAFY